MVSLIGSRVQLARNSQEVWVPQSQNHWELARGHRNNHLVAEDNQRMLILRREGKAVSGGDFCVVGLGLRKELGGAVGTFSFP